MRALTRSEEWLPAGAPSSRRDAAAAGWYAPGEAPGLGRLEADLAKRRFAKWDTFSWLTVRAVLESANDVIARRAPTIIRDRRRRYVAAQRAAGAERSDHGPPTPGLGDFGPDFVIDWTRLRRPRFLLVGDPGEADASQYATVAPILAVHRGEVSWDKRRHKKSDFMVVLSDVIYPAGDINDYVNGFYIPYAEYDRPIYAIPGNHDWYDGLNGFMFHHCGSEPLPKLRLRNVRRRLGERLVRGLWQRASKPDRDLLAPYIEQRGRLNQRRLYRERPCGLPSPRPVQPAPYFAIELEDLILVAIDTGTTGELDAEQGEWLLRVSQRAKPKVLLTGKPIWVNNTHRRDAIAWGEGTRALSVDDIVRNPRHRYLAAIGGDTHNFQRYPVQVGERTIQYIVSGGGGAYLSSTHTIPRVGSAGADGAPSRTKPILTEDEFRCYPLRGDSLALFCRRVGPVLFKTLVTLLLVAGVAAALLFWLIAIDDDRRLAAGLAGLAVAGLLVLTGIAVWRLGRRTAPGAEVYPLLVVLIAAAGVVAALLWVDDPHATVAVVVALAVPLTAVLGVLIAYVGRGSLPTFASRWVLVLPVLALAPALWAPYTLDPVANGLLYGMAPLVAALVLVPLVGSLRTDLQALGPAAAYRVLIALAWLALGAVVVVRFGQTWMEGSLPAVLGLLLLIGYGVARLGPGRRRVHRPRYDTVGPGAGAVVAVSIAGLGLVAVEALAGRDAPALAAAGIAAVIGALAALAAAYLLLCRGLIKPRTLWYLRKGEISPAGAAAFVAQQIGVRSPPTRGGEPTPGDRRRRGMANVVWRLGGLVSEIADTNEPPFYKSFLSLEANADRLEISCWGVTGYADRFRSPSLEDRITMPLGSGASTPCPPRGADVAAPRNRRDHVRFLSQGVECCAWHYRPEPGEPAPCVVLAHGFDGVRDQALDTYADEFADAGLAALVFDYRFFGDSEGQPRQLVSNRAQLDDWRAAIACARSLEGVDPNRIALWGTSTSGGHVVKVGAEDGRVAAIVSQMPFASGFAQFRSMPITQSLRLVAAGLHDQIRAWLGAKPRSVPAVGRPHSLAVTTTRDAVSGLCRITPDHSTWRNEVLARFALRTTLYRPGRSAKRLHCPLLVCIADGDRVMPAKPALKMAEYANDGTLRRYGFGHFGMYYGEGFKRAVHDQVEFLHEHLMNKNEGGAP